jgi:hypothetical protein
LTFHLSDTIKGGLQVPALSPQKHHIGIAPLQVDGETLKEVFYGEALVPARSGSVEPRKVHYDLNFLW